MNNELYFKICRFFKQKKLDAQPFRCGEIFCPLDLDPNIFADPDPGGTNVADPTNSDPMNREKLRI